MTSIYRWESQVTPWSSRPRNRQQHVKGHAPLWLHSANNTKWSNHRLFILLQIQFLLLVIPKLDLHAPLFFFPLLGALVILTVPFLYKTHSIPQALSSPHLLSATGSPKTCVGPLYPTSSSHQEETHKQTWAALELGNRNGLDARLMVITSLDARLMVITSTTIRGYIHMSFIISVCGPGDRMGSQ